MAFYMKINNIDGGVTTKGFEKYIEVGAIDFGVLHAVSVRPGHVTDREGGVPNIGDFIITKPVDKSSPYLLEASCVGSSLGEVKIDACGSNDDSSQYLQYTLNDVIISSYSISGVDDKETNDKPMETLHLNFTKIEMKFTPRDTTNKALSPASAGYDVEKAQKI